MTTINENYGPQSLRRTDLEIPSVERGLLVYATNQGWCVDNPNQHNFSEIIVENINLLNRLMAAGYDRYGHPLEGNPHPSITAHHRFSSNHTVLGVETPEPDQEDAEGKDVDVDTYTESDGVEGVSETPAPEESKDEKETQEEPESEGQQEPEQEPVDEPTETKEVKVYTKAELKKLSVDEVLAVAKERDIDAPSKAKAIELILSAQKG
ncbi:hypothetical protein GR28A_00180 [Vibrio phage vB_VcorM_GR28A]|nr:hypothetical protein GR28A_00180 [Vibrio phage vB_VcorM_GR28A]